MARNRSKTPAQEAVDQRALAKDSAAIARVAKAVGANRLANSQRRRAAESNVVARYVETGRCQFGHRKCVKPGH
jgi:hypothetical protein